MYGSPHLPRRLYLAAIDRPLSKATWDYVYKTYLCQIITSKHWLISNRLFYQCVFCIIQQWQNVKLETWDGKVSDRLCDESKLHQMRIIFFTQIYISTYNDDKIHRTRQTFNYMQTAFISLNITLSSIAIEVPHHGYNYMISIHLFMNILFVIWT